MTNLMNNFRFFFLCLSFLILSTKLNAADQEIPDLKLPIDHVEDSYTFNWRLRKDSQNKVAKKEISLENSCTCSEFAQFLKNLDGGQYWDEVFISYKTELPREFLLALYNIFVVKFRLLSIDFSNSFIKGLYNVGDDPKTFTLELRNHKGEKGSLYIISCSDRIPGHFVVDIDSLEKTFKKTHGIVLNRFNFSEPKEK